ncbi:hypothetical protein KBD59_02070 [Candidatus Gracilibacteria bacterium]|nr:hypothetical protein [Candidatus Gracilibacteria bacterium]
MKHTVHFASMSVLAITAFMVVLTGCTTAPTPGTPGTQAQQDARNQQDEQSADATDSIDSKDATASNLAHDATSNNNGSDARNTGGTPRDSTVNSTMEVGITPDATPNTTNDGGIPTVFTSPEQGYNIRFPHSSHVGVTRIDLPQWASDQALAAAELLQGENRYIVVVYPRQANEELLSWGTRVQAGDAFVSDRHLQMGSGQTGYIYDSNDFGLLPNIHVTVMSDDFVYYFRWMPELPEDPQEAAEQIRSQHLSFSIPRDMIEMLGNATVR